MKSLIPTLLLCLFSLHSSAQFSQYISGQINTPIGLDVEPYNSPFLCIPGMAGLEIGYRFMDRLEVRAFANIGSSNKNNLTEETPSTSRFTEWGLKPQLNLWAHSNEVLHFDVGFPISYMSEEVEWTDFFAMGKDKARLLRLGIAPALRWYYKKTGISFQLAAHLNYDLLLNAHRKIYYSDNSSNELHITPAAHYQHNAGIRLTLGYTFR